MHCCVQGAAFGFSTIATQAGEQLAPYMSQIVPRLYRYQFDPNPRIQQAMSGIWSALVKDNKKTVSGRSSLLTQPCSLWALYFSLEESQHVSILFTDRVKQTFVHP